MMYYTTQLIRLLQCPTYKIPCPKKVTGDTSHFTQWNTFAIIECIVPVSNASHFMSEYRTPFVVFMKSFAAARQFSIHSFLRTSIDFFHLSKRYPTHVSIKISQIFKDPPPSCSSRWLAQPYERSNIPWHSPSPSPWRIENTAEGVKNKEIVLDLQRLNRVS